MVIHYDIEKINALLEDFSKATDISIVLLKPDFSYVGGREYREHNRYCLAMQSSQIGAQNCKCSDEGMLKECSRTRKMQIHLCPGGLWGAAAPLLFNDVIVGYIIFGQMRDNTGFSIHKEYVSSIGLDVALMEQYYAEIPTFEQDKIQSISKVANILTSYIIMENMLKLDFDKHMEKAVAFIDDNLSGDLSVQTIARNIHISKSVLYKHFRTNFDCTINEYINTRRIEKALELLAKTNLSVEEISRRTGFTSASYFSKTFKKLKGISPLQYKKQS